MYFLKAFSPLSLGVMALSLVLSARADTASDYAALTAGLTNIPGSGGTRGQ